MSLGPQNPAAAHPSTKRAGGLLPRPRSVLFATGYYLRAIHEGVVRYARQAGWTLDASMAHTHRFPRDWRGDGVLAQSPNRALAARLADLRVPVVAILSPPPGMRCPSILMDSPAAGRLAAEHLQSRGFTRFAYYQRFDSTIVAARRLGFEQPIVAAGHEFHLLDWASARRREHRRRHLPWLAAALRKLRKPLGVFASGDAWALDVLNACKSASLAVPEEVAVVGVDNDPLYVDIAPVPLTSVDNDLSNIGYRASEMLDDLMRGEALLEGPVIVPPAGVVTRKSTDILAVEDVNVARAIAFILEYFRRPIRVRDVAAVCPVSLRQLQKTFKRQLGRTISQELMRLRLEHAMTLLRTTDQKVEAIAHRCGLASGRYLSRMMKQTTGRGPRAYRRQRV